MDNCKTSDGQVADQFPGNKIFLMFFCQLIAETADRAFNVAGTNQPENMFENLVKVKKRVFPVKSVNKVMGN